MMQTLGKAGFNQSYVLHVEEHAVELVEFVNELLAWSDLLPANREHAGHPPPLPAAGRPARVRGAARPRRHALAELRPLLRVRARRERPTARGLEEYLDFEKYETKERALDGLLLLLVRRLNAIRREHPALQWLDLAWLDTESDDLLAFAKKRDDDVVADVAVNLNLFEEREGVVVLPAWIGLPPAVASASSSPTTSSPGTSGATTSASALGSPTCWQRSARVSEAGQWFESDPLWFKRAVFYEIHTRGFFDSDDDGSGDLRGSREARLPAVAGDRLHLAAPHVPGARCATAATTSPTSTPSTRTTAPSRTSRTSSRRRTGHDHRRLRHEPHLADYPWRSSSAPTPRPGQAAGTTTSGRTRTTAGRRPGSSSSTPSPRTGRGTGARPVLLAPLLQPPARSQLRQPAGAGGDARRAAALARPRDRRLPHGRDPVSLRAQRHERREPPGDPRVPQARPGGGGRPLPRQGAARRGEPVAGRRRAVFR